MKQLRIGSYKLPRMSGWLIAIAALAVIVAIKAPQNLWIVPYKLLLVCVAAWVAHRLDKTFFEDKIPPPAERFAVAPGDDLREISRAIVFLAVVLGLTLGV